MSENYNFLKIASVLYVLLSLTSCGGNAEPREFKQLGAGDKELYNQALADIGNNNQAAIDKLNILELNYPKSSSLPEAMILKLYALYSANKFDDAMLQADRFISLYPKHRSTAYAYYVKGLSSSRRMMDSQRDQKLTQETLQSFKELERQFPNSEYLSTSKTLSSQAENVMAVKQVEVGRFYAEKGQHSAAVDRFQHVIQNYGHTSAAPEAMYRMVEVHMNLNSHDNAMRYFQMLKDRHPNSLWTNKAMKISKYKKYPTKELFIPGEETGFYN